MSDWHHVTPDLLAAIRAQYRLDWEGIHGIHRWERVRENGRRLAASTGADLVVVEFFAALHDACRWNDSYDLEVIEWAMERSGRPWWPP